MKPAPKSRPPLDLVHIALVICKSHTANHAVDSNNDLTRTDPRASPEHVPHGSPSISTEPLVIPARRFAPTRNVLRRYGRRTGSEIGSRRIDELTKRGRRGHGRGRSPRREPRRRSSPGSRPARNEPSQAYRESIRQTVEKRRQRRANRGRGMGDSRPRRRDRPVDHAPRADHPPHSRSPRRDRESPPTAEEVSEGPS